MRHKKIRVKVLTFKSNIIQILTSKIAVDKYFRQAADDVTKKYSAVENIGAAKGQVRCSTEAVRGGV